MNDIDEKTIKLRRGSKKDQGRTLTEATATHGGLREGCVVRGVRIGVVSPISQERRFPPTSEQARVGPRRSIRAIRVT